MDTIEGKRPERILHRALKNIMINEWGLTKDVLLAAIVDMAKIDVKAAIIEWLSESRVKNLIERTLIDQVKAMTDSVIRSEVRAFLDRRIKLTVSATVVEPDGGQKT